MTQVEQFQLLLRSESEADRLDHITNLLAITPDGQQSQNDTDLWRLLACYPTKLELLRLATSLSVSKNPDHSWILASHLLLEADQDIVGNALNSITFSGRRALGHRALRFFASRERPQRILYCLARYAEEAIDRRFASLLSSSMQSDLSDAFLARTFNALFRLGAIDRVAIKVAVDLISSHIDATNMDRKAAVSAIVYLCFAGDQEDIEQLKYIQNKVTIPELRRLLNWGLYELNGFELQGFDADAAKNFLKRAANLAEPNFTGFGCFEQNTLVEGAKLFIRGIEPENYLAATRTILALGNSEIIDLLAHDKKIGLQAIADTGLGDLKLLWKHFLPSHSEAFRGCVRNPDSLGYWNDRDAELLHVMLEAEDFIDGPWQETLLQSISHDPLRSLDLVVAQLLALERLPANSKANLESIKSKQRPESSTKASEDLQNLILSNIEALSRSCATTKGQFKGRFDARILHRTLYSTVIGGVFDSAFLQALTVIGKPPILDSTFLAASMGGSQFCPESLCGVAVQTLNSIEASINSPGMNPNAFVEWVLATFQGILSFSSRNPQPLPDLSDLLERSERVALTIQAILDALDATKPELDPENESSSEDWGHAIKDRPVLRWNAVLQVCLRSQIEAEHLGTYEAVLRDAMRVAPHVEKRWIVTALAKIGSDDAIKSILYQALQHVDGEFVGHTIRQLLKSSHRRAQQALIRCVGRNSISDEIKLSILDEISLENPQELLAELKTLEILRLPAHIDDAIRDAVGRVAAIAGPPAADTPGSQGLRENSRLASVNIDGIIKSLLPESDLLSVDVRSALRTAEMIMIQSKEWGGEAVDLSPIVNMHCKAVELTLRETFEGLTDAIIRRGDLSRRLDILGYARPIPEKMQIFEDYLGQLPIVRSIPYFSKFKLRKMLRAVCLYRPGKRFTLDGPKAFALLFLVGSRKECPFGLGQTVPLAFKNDLDLFEFIKIVHSLQDSRNRAVHEGLTWEAQDEIDGMRSQAYQIINICTRLGKEIRARSSRNLAGLVGVGA
jgi:hypothetical protein